MLGIPILFIWLGLQPAAAHAPQARTEIGKAPPVADEASRFRGSDTIGVPNGYANRNVATVNCGLRSVNSDAHVVRIYDQNSFLPAGRKVCDAF